MRWGSTLAGGRRRARSPSAPRAGSPRCSWPALSLQGRDDVSAFVAGFAGDDRFIVDYLAEEVLARQPADVRDFLLRTVGPASGSPARCATPSPGRPAARRTLVALERANLFLVPLDDRRQWYRYHHLFADVLRAHLLDEHPDEVAELHRRASAWFEAHDDRPQAVSTRWPAATPTGRRTSWSSPCR